MAIYLVRLLIDCLENECVLLLRVCTLVVNFRNLLPGSTHYYFRNCRYFAKYPCVQRQLHDSINTMKSIDDKDRISARAHKAKMEA